jgi:hypothetical protein
MSLYDCLTDVVGVELVDTHENTDGGRTECPFHEGTKHGELARVQVVNQHRVKLLL